MSKEIIKIFDYIGSKLGIAIDWTQQNIQPYLQDLWTRWVQYEIFINAGVLLLNSIVITISVAILFKIFKEYKDIKKTGDSNIFWTNTYYDNEFTLFGLVLMIVIGVIFSFGVLDFIGNFENLIEAIYIPEKLILEQIKNLN